MVCVYMRHRLHLNSTEASRLPNSTSVRMFLYTQCPEPGKQNLAVRRGFQFSPPAKEHRTNFVGGFFF